MGDYRYKSHVYVVVSLLLLGVALMLVAPISATAFDLGPSGKHLRNTYMSPLELAKALDDPYGVKEALLQSLDGLAELGLDSSCYTAILPYWRVEYYTVGRVIKETESAIQRCDHIIEWLEVSNNSVANVADVYDMKIANMQETVGCISYTRIGNAYLIYNDPGWIFWIYTTWWTGLVLFVVNFILVGVTDCNKHRV